MNIRILIIDDELNNLRLLIDVLQHRGFDITLAQNGSEGLQLAIDTLPEIILLDIRMPEMDGFTVYQHLLANPHTANILVIFLSAIDEIDYKEHALNLGSADYINPSCYLKNKRMK